MESNSKVKVGDLVRVLSSDYPQSFPEGSVATVCELDKGGAVLKHARSPVGLYFFHDEFEKIGPEPTTMTATEYIKSIDEKLSPLEVQVGGDHYKNYPIQPVEYCMANKLDTCQANVVKYVTRFREKNGVKDLEKAKHYIDLLIDFENKKEA